MYKTSNFENWLPVIGLLPVGTWFSVGLDGETMELQADGEEAYMLRAVFRGQIWKKSPPNDIYSWWSYKTTLPNGLKIWMYADRTGPKSCKKIVETKQVMEEVEIPVTTRKETRLVTKEVVRWECPDSNLTD